MFVLSKINPTARGVIKNLKENGHKFNVLEKTVPRFLSNITNSDQAIPFFFIPTTDSDNLELLNCFKDLKEADMAFLPDKKSLTLALDKFKLFKTLSAARINTPLTLHIKSGVPKVCGMKYPSVLKANFSGDWKTARSMSVIGDKKAIVIHNEDALKFWVDKISSITSNLILQEIIEQKEDENYSFCGYAGKNGKVLWGFLTKKIIQYPEGFGTALLCRTVNNSELYVFGKNVVESLGLDGIFEVEIIRNARDNKLYVIEINTRHWSQHRLSTRLGVNITMLDFYYRTGDMSSVKKILSNVQRRKVLWIDDIGYIIHCMKNLFHTEKCRSSELLGKKIEFSTFSIKDLRPFLKALKSKFV